MVSLVNQRVKHLKFGPGSIVEEPGEHIKVRFQGNEIVRSFVFPEVFDGFLSFEDNGLQEKFHMLAVARRRQKEQKRMDAIMEREQERRQQQLDLLNKRRSSAGSRTRPAVKQKKGAQEG